VRRARPEKNSIAIGIRGACRNQRLACFVGMNHVLEVRTPAELLRAWQEKGSPFEENAAPWRALQQAAQAWSFVDFAWGPAGSVGYSLATGQDHCSAASDLDLIVKLPHPISREEASRFLQVLPASAVRFDILAETPHCGFRLAEYAMVSGKILLRTPDGPRLGCNPWSLS
jgi:phosphoribosyl-dephospho-CoA transferase